VGAAPLLLLELELDDGPAPDAPAAGLLDFFFELSLLEPALAPVDSREALPAEAPETSELELERGDAPVRFEGKLLESLADGAAWPVGEAAPGGDWLELGAFWARAPVATPAAARAATAQSVVKVRIGISSLRAPSGPNN
jgi:hypothetical protein